MKYNNKTIFRRKDRLHEWFMRYRKGKQQITIYGKTQQEVIAKYKQALKQDKEQLKLEYQQQQAEQQKQYTLKQWFDKFIELYKVNYVTDTTIKSIKYDFEKLKPLHNTQLKELKGMDIQKTINNVPYPSTQIRLHILINSILEKAVLNDLIIKNVAKQVVKPKYQAKQKRALTKEEETIFVNACKKHKFGNFYLICLYQGLRKGEARALKVNDVDFENNTLRIDESLNTHTTRTTTKNKQSNRIMPLFDKTKVLLKELVKGKSKDDLIINIGVNRVDKALRDILKETKLKLSTHILRHTFITRCQELNIPIFIIQSWVGHEKGSVVTTKIYTHLNKDTNKQYIDIFNKNES